jgi:hypothetical protein
MECCAGFRYSVKINADVRKCDSERNCQQPAPHGQDGPEDSGIARLPHPEPFLYRAGNDDQESNECNHSTNNEYRWMSPPEGVAIPGRDTNLGPTQS